MKTKIKIFGFLFMVSVILTPFFSFAADEYKTGEGLVPDCNYQYVAEEVKEVNGETVVVPAHFSDECNFSTLVGMVNKTINFLLFVIATPLFAIIVMYAGYLYLFDGGNSKNATKAKKIMINALVGYGLALIAWLIIKTILLKLGFTGPMFLTLINNLLV